MSMVSAILYGLMQGVTEFLPVSSSGHLALLHGWFASSLPSQDRMTFDILLHLATLLSVFLVYAKEILPLVPAFFTLCGKTLKRAPSEKRTEAERTVLRLLLGTLPLVFVFPFREKIAAAGGSVRAVGTLLLLNALLLFVSDRIRAGNKGADAISARDSLLVGVSQACAILPGLSRSGTTVTFGLLAGMTRETAVRFSFLLSVPAVLGANLTGLPALLREGIPQGMTLPYLCGMLAALASGLFSVKLLRFLSEKAKFKWFGIWCAGIGITALIVG